MCISPQRHAKRSRKPEIRQLQVAVAVDEEILRLQVAMQDAMAVAVAHALDQLAHELLDHGVAQPQSAQIRARAVRQGLASPAFADRQRLHVFLQVEVEELEDEVELVAVGVDDVEEAHDVRVAHLFQEGDFADRGAGDAFVFGFEPDLLERHDAGWVGEVAGFVDNSVGTYTKLGVSSLYVFSSGTLPSPIFSIF